MSKNKSPQERKAICETVLRLGSGVVFATNVQDVASLHRISARSIYRWLKQEAPDDAAAETTRFEVDTAMLTVLAQEQTAIGTYTKLLEAGIIDVSYTTFCRALARQDPALVAGALSGRSAMVANRVYLKQTVPHRCHRYFIDHTKLDVFVLPSHRHNTPVRPHLTVIGDSYSGYIWTFVWYKDPTGADIAAALASTCIERVVDGASIGGIPQQVVMDNAAIHFGQDVRRACVTLGIVISPTSAYSSWQNGQAERAIQLVNKMVTSTAPGATRAGTDKTSARFLNDVRATTDRANFWVAGALEAKVREATHHINTQLVMKSRGGRTRLQLFVEDETERDFLTPEAARMVSLRSSQETHKAAKYGVQFRNKHYISADIIPGTNYEVRFLPEVEDFIELFDEQGRHVTRAFLQDTLSKEERNKVLAQRARLERDHRAVEEGVKAHRRKLAALHNADPESYPSDHQASLRLEPSPSADPELAAELRRTRVPVQNRIPAQSVESADRHFEKVMATPGAQELVAQIRSLNEARSTTEGRDEDG